MSKGTTLRAIGNLNTAARAFFDALAEFEVEVDVNVDEATDKIDSIIEDLIGEVRY
jgi:hypothetical protein